MMTQEPKFFKIEKNGFKVEACCQKLGADYLVSFYGGQHHIGAVGMAQSRPSLSDPDQRSATASVFCYVGHKEDQLVKEVSEILASELNTKVVVVAGLHWDNLNSSGVKQVIDSVNLLTRQILEEVKVTTYSKDIP